MKKVKTITLSLNKKVISNLTAGKVTGAGTVHTECPSDPSICPTVQMCCDTAGCDPNYTHTPGSQCKCL